MPASIETLGDLHETVAKTLKEKIKDAATATAADISAAIKFLKDNGIEARADKSPAVQSLAQQFPVFQDTDEYSVN